MKIYQTIFCYPSFNKKFQTLSQVNQLRSFEQLSELLLSSGYCYPHILRPDSHHELFLHSPELTQLSSAWAKDMSLKQKVSKKTVISNQIEEFGADVVYFQNPYAYDAKFIKNLPGCVKAKICWSSSHISAEALEHYDLVLTSFTDYAKYLAIHKINTKMFWPGVASSKRYADSIVSRKGDIIFAGGWSRRHQDRNISLTNLANNFGKNLSLHLDTSKKFSWLRCLNVSSNPFFIPEVCRSLSNDPKFGFDMIEEFSKHKVIFNQAIDIAGKDRGNIRCFEALTSGGLLVSDKGNYPPEFRESHNFVAYSGLDDLIEIMRQIIKYPERYQSIAKNGFSMIHEIYSKKIQMERFHSFL